MNLDIIKIAETVAAREAAFRVVAQERWTALSDISREPFFVEAYARYLSMTKAAEDACSKS